MRAHPLRALRLAALPAIICTAALVGGASSHASLTAKGDGRLTCSFIAGQCRVECPKQAPAAFCAAYCGERERMCLANGRWTGLFHRFENVERR